MELLEFLFRSNFLMMIFETPLAIAFNCNNFCMFDRRNGIIKQKLRGKVWKNF
jgi:hypothetical protein